MCGFIAHLVEHRTGIAEVTGSNPVEALKCKNVTLHFVTCVALKTVYDDKICLFLIDVHNREYLPKPSLMAFTELSFSCPVQK